MDVSEATRKFLEKKCTCAKCKAQQAVQSSCVCSKCGKVKDGGGGKPTATKVGGGCACGATSAVSLASKPVGRYGRGPPSATPSSTKTGGGCSCSPSSLAKIQDEPCDCAAADLDKANFDKNDLVAQGSDGGYEHKTPFFFGNATFGRKSSENEPFNSMSYGGAANSNTDCCDSMDYGHYPSNMRYTTVMTGRDTLNKPIYLQGRAGLLSSGLGGACAQTTICEEECGIDTGCNTVCKTKTDGRAGIRICNNEMINMLVSFMLEAFGILV